MIITSRMISYYGESSERVLALDCVSTFKGGVSALCDSATYFVTEETVTLRLNPVAWQGDSEMIGKEIDFTMDSLKINEIFLYEKAQIRTLADTLENKYNVLRGKSIQVSLGNGIPERIIARRNAISIYRIEENKIKQGTNSASSDSIIIHFKEGEVDSLSIIGGTEGTFYPGDWEGEIKSEY